MQIRRPWHAVAERHKGQAMTLALNDRERKIHRSFPPDAQSPMRSNPAICQLVPSVVRYSTVPEHRRDPRTRSPSTSLAGLDLNGQSNRQFILATGLPDIKI